MDHKISIVLLIAWSIVSEGCYTPLGRHSECISLYDCPQLLAAFESRPLPTNVISFLKKSQCGFAGYVPRVCCGPLPVQNDEPVYTQRPPQVTTEPSNEVEPVYDEDSLPAPRNKCGLDNNGDRIYGGQITDLDEFPWMALLGYRTKAGRITYQCGGTLINHRYVLTAAHCITGAIETQVGKLVTVRLGEYNTETDQDCSEDVCTDPPQEIPVHSAYPNPGYNDGNKNKKDDIGLIRLSRRAHYSDYVQPICLIDSGARIADGSEVFVAGWGKTLEGRNSQVKQKLGMPTFNKNDCIEKYRPLGANLINRQICAGGTFAEDACRGDSGGPLMKKSPRGIWESIGIVSFGYGCGKDGWPGVYTSVAAYNDWIRSTLESTNV